MSGVKSIKNDTLKQEIPFKFIETAPNLLIRGILFAQLLKDPDR